MSFWFVPPDIFREKLASEQVVLFFLCSVSLWKCLFHLQPGFLSFASRVHIAEPFCQKWRPLPSSGSIGLYECSFCHAVAPELQFLLSHDCVFQYLNGRQNLTKKTNYVFFRELSLSVSRVIYYDLSFFHSQHFKWAELSRRCDKSLNKTLSCDVKTSTDALQNLVPRVSHLPAHGNEVVLQASF